MEVIVNEFSIKEIKKEEDFLEYIRLLKFGINNNILLLKKTNIYDEFTGIEIDGKKIKILEILRNSRSDTIKALKNQLLSLIKEPFWDTNSRQSEVHFYLCEITEEYNGYGVAEASERNQKVFSFNDKTDINILKKAVYGTTSNEEKIKIKNINSLNNFLEVLFTEELIDEKLFLQNYDFKNYNFENLAILDCMISKSEKRNFLNDCLRNDLKNNFIEFDNFSTPEKKKYEEAPFYKEYFEKKLHKYRINSSARCWGYASCNKFIPIYIEKDHSISNK